MEQEKDKVDEKELSNEAFKASDETNRTEANGSETNEISKLSAELAESKDKYLRLYADFENFRRRTSKEKLEYMKVASEDIIKAILPVLDDFERAQKSLASAENNQAAK